MISLQFPEFLLLAIPLLFAFWQWGRFQPAWVWLTPVGLWLVGSQYLWNVPLWAHAWLLLPMALFLRPWLRQSGMTGALRLVILLLLLLALCGPEWNFGGRGIDIIVVADRSRSMPEKSDERIMELIKNLENNRGSGDRLAVVGFGSRSATEYALSSQTRLQKFTIDVGLDGSDLNAALLKALELINPDRPARLLVLSDGESNGPEPTFAARRIREAGVPIDYRLFERLRIGDVGIVQLLLPEEVSPREAFQFSVEIQSERAVEATLAIARDGKPFVRKTISLFPGVNRVPFRDILEAGGIRKYTAILEIDDDPLPENNTGEGIVRVAVPPRILVLNEDGARGNLVRALEAGRLPVDVALAREHPLTLDSLDQYRAVIIENVPASQFGQLKMERLTQYVSDLGNGLLLTGGQRSFGVGGYHQSPLDEILPVSMEMREEHRKTRIALAIALDRSGSMAAPVGGGKTKMDLANLGTAEVIRLLSPGDSVAVIAVDSSPHLIQSLTDVDDQEKIVSKVLGIQSEGGGIFIYEALVAAGQQISQATQATKHIILFSDAADSEEPGDYKKLLAEFERSGITVSVIGLGTKKDIDAKLLEDIASRGRGNIMFTEHARELPRLFAEDTMSVARSSFIEKDPETQPNGIEGTLLPNARLIGNLTLATAGAFPRTDGYNLTYLKQDANAAVKSLDEYDAPWAAFWYRGLGRAAAITLDVDGPFSGDFSTWERYEEFLITYGNWLLGDETDPDLFIDLQRSGQDAVLTVELTQQRAGRGSEAVPRILVIPPGPERRKRIEPVLNWTGPYSLQARFRLDETGTYRTVILPDDSATEQSARVIRGPVVTLPYSPEFDLRDRLASGSDILAEIADITGGTSRTDVLEVFKNPPRSARTRSLLPLLLTCVILLSILEIAGRRLSLWSSLPLVRSEGQEPSLSHPTDKRRFRRPRFSRKQRKKLRAMASESTAATPPSRQAEPSSPPQAPNIDVFAAAKERAKRRTR